MIAPTLTAFVGSVSISWMLWKFLSKRSSLAKHERAAQVIRSPRDTFIPFIALKDHSTLAYPPNALPGARDVSTTYGTMRVYEWGPANGEKVLLIHGDTTPAPVMKPIATGLVDMGRRVMVFGTIFIMQ